MIKMKDKYLIIIEKSKVYLVVADSYEKKKRIYSGNKFGSKSRIEVSSSNILAENTALSECKSNNRDYKHYDLWSILARDVSILKFQDFIKKVLDFYQIKSLEDLHKFLVAFNNDFTYYKIVDKDKVYLNPKELVEKIKDSLSEKENKKTKITSFLKDILDVKSIDNVKYFDQIKDISNYLSGNKKYSKNFIDSVKETLKISDHQKLLNYFKSIGVFDNDFEPIYYGLGLDHKYPYSDMDVNNLIKKTKKLNGHILDALTIDDYGTYDFDDALTIQREGECYLLYIHITNFSALFSEDSVFSSHAKKIINTIYSPDKNFDLFSRSIVDSVSLKSGEVRPVISLKLKVSKLEILSSEIESNLIKVTKNYTYDEFELLIEERPEFIFLNEFSKHLNLKRLNDADFKFFNQEIAIKMNDKKELVLIHLPALESRRIISELMVFGNFKFSEFFRNNGIPGIFRSQKKSNNLETTIIEDNIPFCFHRKVSPVDISSTPEAHFGLGLDSYMQLTSPIRRYMDTINMWQISSFILEKRILFEKSYIDKNISILSAGLGTMKEKSKNIYKFWILKYLYQSEINNLSGYIYASLRDKYIVFFNELNIFESINKENCSNSYNKDDLIEVSFDFIDFQNLNLVNLKD